MTKKTISSIFDESLGGKTRKKKKENPVNTCNMRSDASWLIYVLFLLFLLVPVAIWMLYKGDSTGIYYIYLLLALFVLTVATSYCILR